MRKTITFATAALFLTAMTAQAQTIDKASDKAPDLGLAKTTVEQAFRSTLIDPNSALFEYGEPLRMTCSSRVFPANHADGRWHGWGFEASVNARNRMGGYTGRQPYMVFIVGQSVEVYSPRYRQNQHCRAE